MDNRGLLFIPDISGFTRFVTETEIGHSRLIIQELLEVLMNANQLDLTVSEIEGDAILFYRFGECPDVQTIYKQVSTMFFDFHRSLQAYDQRRFCQCKACRAAIDLTLKVITHYGEFTGYSIRNFDKLIGKDVIVAHQLLKNSIDDHEYWLITDSTVNHQAPVPIDELEKWQHGFKETEQGEIPFYFTHLAPLRERIPPDTPATQPLAGKKKVFTATRTYPFHILSVFHATGDFCLRSKWQHGVKQVEEVDHMLPRIGMRCRRVLENGEDVVFMSSYQYQAHHIVFTETDEKTGDTTRYLIEQESEGRVRLTVEYYIDDSWLNLLRFRLSRKKMLESSIEKSLTSLESLLPTMRKPDEP